MDPISTFCAVASIFVAFSYLFWDPSETWLTLLSQISAALSAAFDNSDSYAVCTIPSIESLRSSNFLVIPWRVCVVDCSQSFHIRRHIFLQKAKPTLQNYSKMMEYRSLARLVCSPATICFNYYARLHFSHLYQYACAWTICCITCQCHWLLCLPGSIVGQQASCSLWVMSKFGQHQSLLLVGSIQRSIRTIVFIVLDLHNCSGIHAWCVKWMIVALQ